MTPIKLIILGRCPSKKNTHRSKWSYKKKRFIIAPSKEAGEWEKSAILQLRNQQNQQGFATIAGKLHIEFKIYLSTFRRKDLSNIIQPCEDALQKAGTIENDFFIESLDGSRRFLGVPEDEQRVEILIRDFKE